MNLLYTYTTKCCKCYSTIFL